MNVSDVERDLKALRTFAVLQGRALGVGRVFRLLREAGLLTGPIRDVIDKALDEIEREGK